MAVFGKDKAGLNGLKDHVRRKGVRYHVLHDGSSSNAKALGIKSYPTAFLLDRTGKVVWEGTLHKKNHTIIQKHIRKTLGRRQ